MTDAEKAGLVFVFLWFFVAGWQLYKRAFPPAPEHNYSDGWRWEQVATAVRHADGSYKTQWEYGWVCCAKEYYRRKENP